MSTRVSTPYWLFQRKTGFRRRRWRAPTGETSGIRRKHVAGLGEESLLVTAVPRILSEPLESLQVQWLGLPHADTARTIDHLCNLRHKAWWRAKLDAGLQGQNRRDDAQGRVAMQRAEDEPTGIGWVRVVRHRPLADRRRQSGAFSLACWLRLSRGLLERWRLA